jgi:hypothetical protein
LQYFFLISFIVVGSLTSAATYEYYSNFLNIATENDLAENGTAISVGNITLKFDLDSEHGTPTLNYGCPCSSLRPPFLGKHVSSSSFGDEFSSSFCHALQGIVVMMGPVKDSRPC